MGQNQSSKPGKVATAIILLYISWGIGVLWTITEELINAPIASPVSALFIIVFPFGIMLFIIHMIGKGRNWARITFFILFIISTLFTVPQMLRSLAAFSIRGILVLAQTVIEIIALSLLFQKPSSYWFRELKMKSVVRSVAVFNLDVMKDRGSILSQLDLKDAAAFW